MIPPNNDVVILCGGLGTRLRPVLRDRPKPMALIDGRPFLDMVVDHVTSHGFNRIIFCTGHHGEWIDNHFRNRTDIETVMSRETTPLVTAGALRACRRFFTTSPILVLNGDSLCRIDLTALMVEHRRRKPWATVTVVRTDGCTDGGGITLDAEHRVVAFHEKETGPYLSAGIYVLEASLLNSIPEHNPSSLEHDVFPAVLSHHIYGFLDEAALFDIGTPERLKQFREDARAFDDEHVGKGESR